MQTLSKKIKKISKKVLTLLFQCCIINKLSRETATRTLITKQWNNPENFRINFQSCSTRNIQYFKYNETDELSNKLAHLSQQTILWEFDPGSGWTLAACLTHASRTKHLLSLLKRWLSGGRVSNAWVTCLTQGDNS